MPDTNTTTTANTTDNNEEVCMETCDYCGCEFPAEDAVNVGDDESFCPDCADEKTTVCVDCHRRFRNDDTREVVGHGTVCDDCYSCGEYVQCYACDDFLQMEDSVYVDGGDYYVCQRCYESRYATCEACSRVFRDDEVSYCESRDAYYCDDCYPDEDEANIVHDYHWGRNNSWYSPKFAPGETGEEITLGVELEMDGGSFAEEMGDEDTFYHFERDGSLSSRGVEVITQPGSLRWHREVFAWRARCEEFRKHGFLSHDASSSCGFHVHIGRGKDMTPLTAAKLDMFINRNEPFFKRLARRNSDSWGTMDPAKATSKSTKEARQKRSNRYQAVNHNNGKTVEIRIAKGTLNPETILGTLEIYHELVLFLKNRSVADAADNTGEVVRKFIGSIMERGKEFPEAVAVLKRLCKRFVSEDAAGEEANEEEA